MKDLMKKLNELVAMCETKIKKADAAKEQNGIRSAALDKQEIALKDLNEMASEGFERLNALKVKHEDLEDAKRLKKELSGEVKRYQALQKELQAKFDDADKVKAAGLAEVEDKKEKIQVERSKLEADKKTYKKEVMSSISKELKSKGIVL